MEENKLKELRLAEVTSSGLLVRGGASVASDIMSKIKSFINFLADYVPKLIEGFKAGFTKKEMPGL